MVAPAAAGSRQRGGGPVPEGENEGWWEPAATVEERASARRSLTPLGPSSPQVPETSPLPPACRRLWRARCAASFAAPSPELYGRPLSRSPPPSSA